MPFLDEPYKPFATAQRLANEEINTTNPARVTQKLTNFCPSCYVP